MDMKHLAEAAGVAHFCLHDLRRTMASSMWDLGKGREAQILLGHANISTTAMYDKRGEDSALESVEKLAFPY